MVLGIEEFIKFYNHTANNIKERVQEEKNKGEDTYFCEKELAEAFENALRYEQLAEWLTELKEAKRLLKLAIDDFSNMYDHIFDCDGMCDTCPLHGERDHCLIWRYANEAEKLLKED